MRAANKITVTTKVDRTICPRLVNLMGVPPDGWPSRSLAAAPRNGIAFTTVVLADPARPFSMRCTRPIYSTFLPEPDYPGSNRGKSSVSQRMVPSRRPAVRRPPAS
jgi:hypothetical protein